MTANAKNLSTLANVLDDGTNGQFLQSTGSGGIVFADVAAGASVYDSAELLPLSGNDAGDMAYVNSTNRFYINNGTGWYSISLVNTNPNITSVQDASASTTPFSLATDGTATVITITANDPEGIPLTYNYSVTSGSLTNGGGTTATVTQSDNVFTVTPSTTEAYAGTFDLTFTASDGINTATNANSFTLSFSENAYYIDPRDHGMTTGSFAGCGINSNDVSLYVLGYSGDQRVYKWDLGTPAELASIPNTYTQRASITNGTPAGFYINQAGTYYYYMSYGNVYQVSLSTANDLTTGTETSAWQTTSGQAFNNSGLIFGGTLSHTGHKLYISETNTNNIHEYPLNTNWDISTAQNRTNSFNPNNITYAYGMGWSTDGMKLWAGEYRYVREYSASSAYSLSGMSATPSASFDIQSYISTRST